jgi:polysaccharide biosynthesis/export protein
MDKDKTDFSGALWAFAAALLLSFAAACASAPPAPAAAPSQEPVEYKIGAGDQLQVFVWNNKDLSTTVPVRPDGLISTPLVEDMQAAGKTPSELARDLEKALSEYVRTPKVNVIVTSFVGGAQVRVVGQAVNPQALPYRSDMTLLDVMIAVGGLGEFAAGNRAKIVRRTADGAQQEIRVRLADLLNRGDMAANMAMEPGDVLIIPETRF